MKKTLCIVLCICSVALVLLTGCLRASDPVIDEPVRIISEIAYSTHKSKVPEDCLIYIAENGIPTPYIVLDDAYNSYTLLLRKEVLKEQRNINKKSSYYGESSISSFLNNEFYQTIDKDVRSQIVDTPIKITKKAGLGHTGRETEEITQKVFLLAASEVNPNTFSVLVVNEGKGLEYFNDYLRLPANDGEKIVSWWLRSPNSYYDNVSFIVGENGVITEEKSSEERGIRPAFCVKGSARVHQVTDAMGITKWQFK